jgi:hypothetical protein
LPTWWRVQSPACETHCICGCSQLCPTSPPRLHSGAISPSLGAEGARLPLWQSARACPAASIAAQWHNSTTAFDRLARVRRQQLAHLQVAGCLAPVFATLAPRRRVRCCPLPARNRRDLGVNLAAAGAGLKLIARLSKNANERKQQSRHRGSIMWQSTYKFILTLMHCTAHASNKYACVDAYIRVSARSCSLAPVDASSR